ncbi:MAG: hypothetical protein A2Z16_15645 [Chloroflexi bacterium RBG_16_54_18]|nr:MAG: hypothetical protein A2Z16_15645 [Chloroflexi bacterium RBG_16_54_18]
MIQRMIFEMLNDDAVIASNPTVQAYFCSNINGHREPAVIWQAKRSRYQYLRWLRRLDSLLAMTINDVFRRRASARPACLATAGRRSNLSTYGGGDCFGRLKGSIAMTQTETVFPTSFEYFL